eukprot:scaffold36095_cov59-Phaeocystis_antarctica.AAC.4
MGTAGKVHIGVLWSDWMLGQIGCLSAKRPFSVLINTPRLQRAKPTAVAVPKQCQNSAKTEPMDPMLRPQMLPDEVSVRGISGDISIISQALNNMPPDGCCPLEELGLAVQFAAEPAKPAKESGADTGGVADDADLQRLGQEWSRVHVQTTEDGTWLGAKLQTTLQTTLSQTTEDGTRHARPRADIGRDIKVAVPPPSIKVAPPSTSATLQRQGSGNSSCSSGSGGGLSSKRPASSGPASTSSVPAKKKRASRSGPAKKERAFTSPYHEFCQERRPFVPAGLTCADREKVLGMAWKAKLADEKRARMNAEQQRSRATPTPLPGGAHASTRVAWDHATLTRNATHAPAPQSQLRAAPPAPQLAVSQAAPHWIKLAVTDG